MLHTDIARVIEQGSIVFPDGSQKLDSIAWYSPPCWNGVSLKDLITAKDTGGAFSYHLVKIQKHCEVPNHNHNTQWEWNVILNGNGSFILGDKHIPVIIGQTFASPPGIYHTVQAGNRDLILMAMFIPALE